MNGVERERLGDGEVMTRRRQREDGEHEWGVGGGSWRWGSGDQTAGKRRSVKKRLEREEGKRGGGGGVEANAEVKADNVELGVRTFVSHIFRQTQ